MRYTALFTFIYSPREGTKAAKMEDPVPEEEKSKWLRQLLTEQSNIRQEMQEALIGKKLRVLAEGKGKSGDGYLTGRNVSGDIVEFSGEENLIGSFVDVQVEKALNWAVFGKLV